MAQDKFPFGGPKSSLQEIDFSFSFAESPTMTNVLLSPRTSFVDGVRAWIIYWCNCLGLCWQISVPGPLCYLSKRQKVFLQNIDINHLLRGECHALRLAQNSCSCMKWWQVYQKKTAREQERRRRSATNCITWHASPLLGFCFMAERLRAHPWSVTVQKRDIPHVLLGQIEHETRNPHIRKQLIWLRLLLNLFSPRLLRCWSSAAAPSKCLETNLSPQKSNEPSSSTDKFERAKDVGEKKKSNQSRANLVSRVGSVLMRNFATQWCGSRLDDLITCFGAFISLEAPRPRRSARFSFSLCDQEAMKLN